MNPGALHGYWDSSNTEHVNFVDANGDVHELLWDGKSRSASDLSDNDLTSLARSRSVASPATALTGYLENDSQHVNFVSEDGHIHELLKHPGHQWVDNDLTVTGNEMTSAMSLGGVRPDALIGYWEQDDNSQHIYFITNDDHVHHLHWNGSHWADEDLTYLGAGCTRYTQPAVPGVLAAYKSPLDMYEAITFIGKTSAASGWTPGMIDVFRMYAHSSGDQCPAPTVQLSADPTSVSAGQSSTLSWKSSFATSCTGTGFNASGTSGATVVTPSATTTYSITCSGHGKSATANATVTVTPPICRGLGCTCKTDNDCSAGLTCSQGTCQQPSSPCPGGAGCMCKSGGVCNANLTCVAGTCFACGHYSQQCCPGSNACSSGLIRISGDFRTRV